VYCLLEGEVVTGPGTRRPWRRRAIAALGALACGVLGACGGGGIPTAPAPSPEPVSSDFLHALAGDSVITYRIDAATGQLRPTATQTVGDAHTLTGEPRGRYVFAAFGPRRVEDRQAPSIVAYSPDPSSGSLKALSEATSDPVWCPTCAPWGRSQEWYWLSASATRVYSIWETVTYHDVYHTYVTHTVGDDGRLGPAYQEDLDEQAPPAVALDVDSDVFYTGTYPGGVVAHFVEPDGRLAQTGASRLCVASTMSSASPLAAVRGFLFATGYVGPHYDRTVCSWEGARLAPRADLGMRSFDAVAIAPRLSASPPASFPAPLVAMEMGSGGTGQYEIRLFAVSPDGELKPLEAITGPGWVRHLLFHPSGRFFYVSHAATGTGSPVSLTVYGIDVQGRVALVQTLKDGGGTMAVTWR
jgi:6-phosphogluconolactonase (cycloisomerase 2 family)